jgi:hypothetical protein
MMGLLQSARAEGFKKPSGQLVSLPDQVRVILKFGLVFYQKSNVDRHLCLLVSLL